MYVGVLQYLRINYVLTHSIIFYTSQSTVRGNVSAVSERSTCTSACGRERVRLYTLYHWLGYHKERVPTGAQLPFQSGQDEADQLIDILREAAAAIGQALHFLLRG